MRVSDIRSFQLWLVSDCAPSPPPFSPVKNTTSSCELKIRVSTMSDGLPSQMQLERATKVSNPAIS